MFENITSAHEQFFDDVLTSRRSVRAFQPAIIEKERIEKIIRAGIVAPFAAIPAAGTDDFRRFIVISTSSEKFEILSKMIDQKIQQVTPKLEKVYENHPYTQAVKQAGQFGTKNIIGDAPWILIVGERRVIPDNASESLSYCMQNMWLKAISLRIGFRLLAILSQLELEQDDDFCDLLGLESYTYAMCACALGYADPAFVPPAVNYPDFDKTVVFFE